MVRFCLLVFTGFIPLKDPLVLTGHFLEKRQLRREQKDTTVCFKKRVRRGSSLEASYMTTAEVKKKRIKK